MYVDFDQLPDTARVWVYQANRSLMEREVATVYTALQPALQQWTAHGQPLVASTQVITNRFVLISVDEGYALPSGCSIDASVRTLQQIGQQIGVDFFDRSAAIQSADGSVQTFTLSDLKGAVAAGQITIDTLVYNTLVKTKAEFMTNWQIRAIDSWLKRYFKPIAI